MKSILNCTIIIINIFALFLVTQATLDILNYSRATKSFCMGFIGGTAIILLIIECKKNKQIWKKEDFIVGKWYRKEGWKHTKAIKFLKFQADG